MRKINILILGYVVVIICLFLYSYTQVDLSLTLSRASIFQTIEKSFQYIGYFNRPLSTYLFCAIVGLMFVSYGLFLKFAKEKKLSLSTFWKILIPATIILTFTYNAFSYDLFNYIFYTKIILHYHQNPYLVTALDFPHDPMLSFMHWTHNTYPYGPLWLVLTVPLGLLQIGGKLFLPTFFIFKMFSAGCFLLTVFFVSKILKKIAPEYQLVGTLLYALNPLVLIESLVSAHNDGAMMLLAIIGMYLLLQKKWWGIIFIGLSAFTKQATEFLSLPTVLYAIQIFLKKEFISQKIFLYGCVAIMLVSYIAVAIELGIQPWYALWFFPFIIFVRPPKLIVWATVGLTLGVLLRYVPFLWQGDWNGEANTIEFYVTVITPLVFLGVGLIEQIFFKNHAKA